MFAAYGEVRADDNDTMFAVFKYEGNKVVLADKGTDYATFLSHFTGAAGPLGLSLPGPVGSRAALAAAQTTSASTALCAWRRATSSASAPSLCSSRGSAPMSAP